MACFLHNFLSLRFAISCRWGGSVNDKNRFMCWFWAGLLVATALVALPRSAQAVPKLQLYLEGASYDDVTETWLASGDGTRLWAIGDVGSAGTISNVRLSVAYAAGLTPTITLTGSTIDPTEFPGMTDSTDPGDATLIQTVTDGSAPVLGSGADLPSHGIYGPQTDWQEFALGDFTATDSQIGDWIDSFPTSFPSMGQINVYDVTVAGLADGATVHFDLYDGIAGGRHGKFIFAPFSHDGGGEGGGGGTGGEGGGNEDPISVPAPGGLALFIGGLAGFLSAYRRRRA